MKPVKVNIKENINLYYIPTKKFKTTTLGIYIHRPLTREKNTLNSLLSMVIRRGCPGFEDTKELSRHLDNLYGAAFVTTVRKKADRQIICANFQFINDRFIDDEINILDSVLELAESAVLKQNFFKDEYVKQEKENLKKQLMAIINDKRAYANKRCTEIMCKGEAYGIPVNGYIEDIDNINTSMLINHYKDVVLKSPVDIFVNGDVDIERIAEKLKSMFKNITVSFNIPAPEDVKNQVGEVKNITEEQQIVQGKLSMGFRTNVYVNDIDYPAMMMYNSILGSGIFSKLFNNVREKLSLCYYASSAVDYLKGVMFINSGIEVSNFKKAYDEILVQMEDIKKGNISDMEFSAALLGTVNSINSISDNPFILDDYYLGRIISGEILTLEDLVKLIKKVTKEEVMEVAEKIELDTVYFLKGSEN